jgi:hypothetical protein
MQHNYDYPYRKRKKGIRPGFVHFSKFSPSVLFAVERLMLATALTAEKSSVAASAAPFGAIHGQRAVVAGARRSGDETRAVSRASSRYGFASMRVTSPCEAAIDV